MIKNRPNNIIIYRAMCLEEFQRTIKYRVPDFSLKRFKWFSQNICFILNRVKDGKFNNTLYKPDRYIHIISFIIDRINLDKADFINVNEIQFDRKKNPKIKLLSIIK